MTDLSATTPLEWFYVIATCFILAMPLFCFGPKGMLRVRRSRLVRAPLQTTWRSVDVLDPSYLSPKTSETVIDRDERCVTVNVRDSDIAYPIPGALLPNGETMTWLCLERTPMHKLRWELQPGPDDTPDVLPPPGRLTREDVTLETCAKGTRVTLQAETYETLCVIGWLGARGSMRRELAAIALHAETGKRT